MATSAGHGVAHPVASLSGLQVVKNAAKTAGGEARWDKAPRQLPLPSSLAGRKETGRWAPQIQCF